MPSRQDLIAAALAEGRIDNVTSLVYRAEALFDLPELPAEFAGAPSLFEDTALFNQIVDLMPTLPPDDQTKLRPFIARPTEADSIFASGGLPGVGRRSDLLAARGFVTAQASPVDECRTWFDSATLSSHFKVWACASADSAADQSAVASVAAFLDGVWPKMTKPVTAGLGEPLADGRGPAPGPEFGGDGRIDVYLLKLSQSVFRAGYLAKLPGGKSAAAALPSEPFDGNTASGFLMIDRERLGQGEEWHNDVIHEFFHVLQYAHNRRAWLSGETQQWFVEASATWAETYYGNSSLVHGWFNDFQLSPLGLESSDLDHDYAAYIWPIFMQQETGSADAIFKAWQAIERVGAGDFKGVSDAIDAQLKFADRFRDFAVRNLNRDILGQVTKPTAEKRYQQLDLTIPDYNPVPIEGHAIELGPPKRSATVTIPPLSARYFYFEGTDLARFVTLDLTALSPTDSLDADVLAHVNDHWERRPVRGSKFTYCRDSAEDDIDQLYLVVSNHSREDSSTINGSVVTTATTCNAWQGTMTATEKWGLGGTYGTATSTFEGVWTVDPTAHETCLVGPEELQVDCITYRPTGTVNWTWDAHVEGDPPCNSTTSGSADPAAVTEPSARELNFAPVDKDHLQVSGFGNFKIPPVKCGFAEINARFPPPYFELLEAASSANPPGQDGSTCYTTTWQIEIKAATFTGSCTRFDYVSPAFFPHSLQYTWNLTRTGDAPGG